MVLRLFLRRLGGAKIVRVLTRRFSRRGLLELKVVHRDLPLLIMCARARRCTRAAPAPLYVQQS